MTTEELVRLAKKTVILARKYRAANRDASFDDEQRNKAIADWVLMENKLAEAITEYDEEEKRERNKHIVHRSLEEELFKNNDIKNTEMYYDPKREQYTRLVVENSYGHKITQEWDSEDVSIEDLVHAFYTSLVGLTWQPKTILNEFKEYAEERLDIIAKDNDDE